MYVAEQGLSGGMAEGQGRIGGAVGVAKSFPASFPARFPGSLSQAAPNTQIPKYPPSRPELLVRHHFGLHLVTTGACRASPRPITIDQHGTSACHMVIR